MADVSKKYSEKSAQSYKIQFTEHLRGLSAGLFEVVKSPGVRKLFKIIKKSMQSFNSG